MKKIVSLCLTVLILVMSISAGVNAQFNDVPNNASYSGALNRMAELGILTGYGDGSFKPDAYVTREQFARILIVAAGLDGLASNMKGISLYNDVEPNSWSCGYINVAVNKGYMNVYSDFTFRPKEYVLFGDVCTALVKLLGYTDKDVSGAAPWSYINKAKELGMLPGIGLTYDKAVQRWVLAVMLDQLMNIAPKGEDKLFGEVAGHYIDCQIIASKKILDTLASNQVATDRGIFYLSSGMSLQVGYKYGLVISGDKIVKAYSKANSTKYLTVKGANGTQIEYTSGGKKQYMTLPNKTVYYYRGKKVENYDDIKKYLKIDTGIIFTYNKDKSGFETAIIIDPVYSVPQVAVNYNPASKKVGNISLSGDVQIIKNGDIITPEEIMENDVVYEVTDICYANKYIQVIDDKVEGVLEKITPSKLAPQTIQLSGKEYEVSKDMNTEKLKNSPNQYKIGDTVNLLLGYDGKVVDMVYPAEVAETPVYAFLVNYKKVIGIDGTQYYNVKLRFTDNTVKTVILETEPTNMIASIVKYVVNEEDETVKLESVPKITPEINKQFQNITDIYTDYSIIGTPETMTSLGANQVMTDKGIMNVNENVQSLEIGCKYRVLADEDVIVKVYQKIGSASNITVLNIVGDKITYIDKYGKTSKMVISDKTSYYYNGIKLSDKNDILNRLSVNTGIILGHNDEEGYYETAIIFDPVYGEPQVAVNYNPQTLKIGNISLFGSPTIIKNGDIITPYDIEEYDVAYEVKDIWNRNSYILVCNNKVEGTLKEIYPNRLSPRSIKIEEASYEISSDMNLDKIKSANSFKVDESVILVLGYDNKAVDIFYPSNSDTSEFAFVINTISEISTDIATYGKTTYYVKLLLDNGAVVTYKTDGDMSNLKGKLVRYTKNLDPENKNIVESVKLESVTYINQDKPVYLNKSYRMIDGSCATENIKIFNFISYGDSNNDAQVQLINWSDLPDGGMIPARKILYQNKIGDFNDTNLIVFDDLFNQRDRLAIISGIDKESAGKKCIYYLLIDGVEHKFTSDVVISGADVGSVLNITMIDGKVYSLYDVANPSCQDTKIQAIDTKRIMMNGVVYLFGDNVDIYRQSVDHQLKKIGTDEVKELNDEGKLRNIRIYLDKPVESGGKVQVIVVEDR